jgi:hypothetical protein
MTTMDEYAARFADEIARLRDESRRLRGEVLTGMRRIRQLELSSQKWCEVAERAVATGDLSELRFRIELTQQPSAPEFIEQGAGP